MKGYCPVGWFGTSKKCFKVVFLDESNGLTWIQAQNKCRSYFEKADLATINTQDENLMITTKIMNTEINSGLWFGLYKGGPFMSNREWVWSDNSPKPTDDDFHNWKDPSGVSI